MHSIGLDISKSTIAIYIPKGQLSLEIDNTLQGVKSLYAKLKKLYKKEFGDLVFVFEPTGSYSALLTKFCHEKKIKAFIINPKQSKNYAKALGRRNKTDRIDAEVLSKAIAVAEDKEIAVPHIDEGVEEIKELMSYYRFIVKQRVKAVNHLEALESKNGSSYAIKDLRKNIAASKHQEQAILSKIRQFIASDERLEQGYENIRSITGIGEIAAIVLLHLFLKYPDANQRQIVSLTGLEPVERESGSSVKGRTKISKAGSKLYRGLLFMSAMVSIRHNKQMKQFFERLKANGKHTTAAQTAVMRKLVIIAHSLYKNNEKYDAQKYNLAMGA
jgi:transposase